MIISILTLFPEFFSSPLNTSIIKRAREKNIVEFNIIDIRSFCEDKHKTADDRPYGGGPGMILKPEPLYKSIKKAKELKKGKVIYLSPKGTIYNQSIAQQLKKIDHIILLCGHYEGIDERIRKHFVDMEISVGDYILTGGEVAALVIIDTVVRLLPDVLGNKDSINQESFVNGLLDYPHYTRPYNFMGYKVPDILLSGNHKKIAEWRLKKSIEETRKKRPDLYKKYLAYMKMMKNTKR